MYFYVNACNKCVTRLRTDRCIWKDNIKMDLQEMGCGVWTGLGWLRIETGCGCL
jgi:hypothetical protein